MLPWPLQDPTQGGEPAFHVEETFRFLAMPDPWVVGLVILPATVAFAWWSYGGLSRLEPRTRWTLSVLRGLAVAFVLLLLFQPAFEQTIYRKTQSQVHVLVDDSASMQRIDTYPDADQREELAAAAGLTDLGGRNRAELVRAVLEKPGGLLDQLRQTHDVRLFRFQRKPLPVRSLAELTARGPRTAIGDALDLHLASASTATLDAVILVSDGRNNAGSDPGEIAGKYAVRGIPIHTIGVGDPLPPKNAWIVGPAGPKEALREEEVAFDVTLRAEGLRGAPATVTLSGSRDSGPYLPLASASASLPDDGNALKVRLYHAFQQEGDYTLKFEVALAADAGESTLDDNVDIRFLRVNDEKIRVLYIEERPRWEYRYIQRALKRVDPSIVMQAWLFDASPRFPQEHSEGLQPLHDIPRTDKEMFQYHVILLGDVPPERIARTEEGINEWLSRLVRFVELGGGVGFLYGDKAMPERYRNTPLEDLLPVVLEDPLELQRNPAPRDQEFRPLMENPLQPHDILLLRRDPATNRKLWEQGFKPLFVYHKVLRAKPGAQVLLRHPTDENRYGKRPLAVAGFYPRGRTFWMGTDETWRWRNPYGETYQDTFWRNVARYLAGGRLTRRDDLVELNVDKLVLETGDKVRVHLLVHDEELQPAVSEEYPIFLRRADGLPERRSLRGVPGEPGAFQGAFTMLEPGSYSVLVFANNNPADRVVAREDILVKIPDREMARSSQDRPGLERIAGASGTEDGRGRYLPLARAADLAADFADRKPSDSREETKTRPAWDSLWSLLILLTILSTEWILRKRARLV